MSFHGFELYKISVVTILFRIYYNVTMISYCYAKLIDKCDGWDTTTYGDCRRIHYNTGMSGGFVFEGGSVFRSGRVLLGRAYGAYSRVIFHGTDLGQVVAPQGWDAWSYKGQE